MVWHLPLTVASSIKGNDICSVDGSTEGSRVGASATFICKTVAFSVTHPSMKEIVTRLKASVKVGSPKVLIRFAQLTWNTPASAESTMAATGSVAWSWPGSKNTKHAAPTNAPSYPHKPAKRSH